jgi:hypothetical protein
VLLAPVVAAFLVKRRHEVVRVPSTFLFRLAGIARARSRRIRNLVRVLALVACVLGVTCLVLAAARPEGAGADRTLAVVVDVSASMGDGRSGTPLGQARAYVRRLLLARGARERIAIIAAGATPRRLAGPTTSSLELSEASRALRPTREAADIGAALRLAAALVASQPGAEILLLHDGGAGLSEPPYDLGGALFRERIVAARARASENLGITVFATRPSDAATTRDEREALVAVATSSKRPRRAEVVLEAFGAALARREVEVPAQGEAEVRISVRSPARQLVARVQPLDGERDALPADDTASLAHGPVVQERVLLAGAADDATAFFVEQALRAAGVRQVVYVGVDQAARSAAGDDIVVLLDSAPDRPIDAPALYVATRSGRLPFALPRELSAARNETSVRSIEDGHPLVGGVTLDGMTVERAWAVEADAGARTHVALDGGAVVLSGGAGRTGWVYLGIDPMGSDLVLRVAFPVLVGNALAILGGAAEVARAETIPRSEVGLGSSNPSGAAEAASIPLGLPFSHGTALALLAVLLLAVELVLWRRGWFAR